MNLKILEQNGRCTRREMSTRRILHMLRPTILLRGRTTEISIEDIRIDFTDESAIVLAPLIEAVNILEAIVWASDGCVGHRQCAHSM